MVYRSCFNVPSISACTDALISLRSIFSAPTTASSATRSQLLRARSTSCSISAFAPATTLSASTLAVPFASSTICCARFSLIGAMKSADFSLASRRASAERLAASSCSFYHVQLLRLQRSVLGGLPSLFGGGQTYFIVIQMKSPKPDCLANRCSVNVLLTSWLVCRVSGYGDYFSRAKNGFAKSRNRAIPTPIIVTASSRPATMNILTCSVGIISGWRAAPSKKRPPRIPKPIAVPRAPAPIKLRQR